MESRYVWEPITVAADWTAEKDFAEFIARFGESDDYFAQAKDQVEEGFACLDDAVDRAVNYFDPGPKNLAGRSISDRINSLEILLAKGVPNRSYREGSKTEGYCHRFAEDLRYCRFVLGEHDRIMPIYAMDRENTWLLLLADVADHLTTAAIGLEESMD